VTFSPLSYSDQHFEGRILSISTLAKEGVYRSHKKFFEVIVDIDKTDAEAFDLLKPGMVCKLKFLIRDWGEVTAVPKDYVGVNSDGVPYIRIQDDPERTRVQEIADAPETRDHYLLRDPLMSSLTLIYRGENI